MKRALSISLSVLLLLGLGGCSVPEYVNVTSPPPSSISVPVPSSGDEAPASALPEPEDDNLVRVLDYIPDIRQDLAYATANNFTGIRIYDFTDVYLRYGTVKKLSKVCEELAEQGLGLKIWDGFRPLSAQAFLWELCPDESYVSHPVTGNRSHCRGSAVDVTLVKLETGEELPVPTGFDHFTAYADRDYSDCSPIAAQNARLLEQTMEKHGFTPYFAEWWHFADADDYPVDETFYPAVPSLWRANCEEYINLRAEAGGEEILAQIPDGELIELRAWSGRYALVSYREAEGYVLSSYIQPEEESYLSERLNILSPTDAYSHAQMQEDMAALLSAYPDAVSVSSIGVSELGLEIPVLRIGRLDARYHVLLQGAIHGREHMTAWLLMAMAETGLNQDILSYGDVCYHIIPMSNPDGVAISQSGALNKGQQEIYDSDTKLSHSALEKEDYASLWKANGLGVDVNRNFPSGWEGIDERDAPSSAQYRGEHPFSSAEARALRDYSLQHAFDATISYHATGSLIYYEYGQKQPVNESSRSLAEAVEKVTGYPPEGSEGVDGAGYKDWAIDSLQIPSLTIEIGCEDAPLSERELYSVFVRNARVLPAVARWLQR